MSAHTQNHNSRQAVGAPGQNQEEPRAARGPHHPPPNSHPNKILPHKIRLPTKTQCRRLQNHLPPLKKPYISIQPHTRNIIPQHPLHTTTQTQTHKHTPRRRRSKYALSGRPLLQGSGIHQGRLREPPQDIAVYLADHIKAHHTQTQKPSLSTKTYTCMHR